MDARTGKFGEQDVARHDHFLARRRPAAQTERDAPVTFVHHTVGHERIILAMIHHRQIKHFGVFQRAAHEFVVLHAMAVVGDGHDAGAFERADGCEFLARDVFGNGAGDKDIYDAVLGGAFIDEGDGPGVVNGRGRVGHADDRGEAAPRGGGGAGGDVFLCRLTGLAQVDVQINQAGTNNESAHVHPLDFARRFLRRVRSDRRDFACRNQNIRFGVESVGRIHDAPASEKQRCHAREATRAELTTQARAICCFRGKSRGLAASAFAL